MDKKGKPLSIMLEDANRLMLELYNTVQQQTGLPAYLMEGILLNLLSQVRGQKNVELIHDMNDMNKMNQSEQKEGAE